MIDLVGQKFGILEVIKWIGKDKWRVSIWLCKCSCGNKIIVTSSNFKNKNTKSCGCLKIKHNLSNNEIYMVWYNMIQRCTNPNNKDYHNYGNRGITIHKHWLNSLENFHQDMPGWKPGLQIERRNNKKGYYPDNCYWATHTEQNRNK